MLEIRCHGTPFEIGQQHGRAAKEQVRGSIAFYKEFLTERTKLPWPEVCKEAAKFVPMLALGWPSYLEEMEGIANGADVDYDSVLVLNVRTEIAYGMLSDGCTAFSWKTKGASFLAQNWDWDDLQTPNLVKLHIEQASKPSIHMMTEAGILGKIGLNSSGVGVTLNAVQAKGVDFNRLPAHFALRTALECESQKAVVEKLSTSGVASSCHITVADATSGGVGLEFSAYDVVEIQMNESGMCTHTNHFIGHHVVKSKMYIPDSPVRLTRVNELLRNSGPSPSIEKSMAILKDKQNYPASICRGSLAIGSTQTLFTIAMDLNKRYAMVKMSQPTEDGEQFELRP